MNKKREKSGIIIVKVAILLQITIVIPVIYTLPLLIFSSIDNHTSFICCMTKTHLYKVKLYKSYTQYNDTKPLRKMLFNTVASFTSDNICRYEKPFLDLQYIIILIVFNVHFLHNCETKTVT